MLRSSLSVYTSTTKYLLQRHYGSTLATFHLQGKCLITPSQSTQSTFTQQYDNRSDNQKHYQNINHRSRSDLTQTPKKNELPKNLGRQDLQKTIPNLLKNKFKQRANSTQTSRIKKVVPSNKNDKGVEELRAAFLESLNHDRERRIRERTGNVQTVATQKLNGLKKGIEGIGATNNSKISQENNITQPERVDRLSRLDELLSRSFAKKTSTLKRRENRFDQRNSGISNSWRENSNARGFRERKKSPQDGSYREKYRHENRFRPGHRRGNNNASNESQRLHEELIKSNSIAVAVGMDDDDDNDDANQFDTTTGKCGDGDPKQIVLPYRKELSISEISSLLRVPTHRIVKTLRNDLGESIENNNGEEVASQTVDLDVVELLALEMNFIPTRSKRIVSSKFRKTEKAERRMLRQSLDDTQGEENMKNEDMLYYQTLPLRPPVVSVMGHVDHGKTTLMDSLREKSARDMGITETKKKRKKKAKTSKKKKGNGSKDSSLIDRIAGSEAGGITQVISAFQIQLPGSGLQTDNEDSDKVSVVTVLDTPGHAAFKAMRESGSNGSDVIVLVVAADDGVSSQTVEIIDMYKSIARAQPGSISLVVAVTKVDKPDIDIQNSMMKIENQLMEHDIYTESMTTSDCEFGDVQMYPVSGLTGEGIDELVEGLVLVSDIMDLRADKSSRAEGIIIDAKVEKGLGVVVDVIIRSGSLQKGDCIVSGINGGRVKILKDANNISLKSAGPSQPVRISGFRTLPKAGDALVCVKSEEIMNDIIERRQVLQDSDTSENDSYRVDRSSTMDIQITGVASKQDFMKQNVLNRYTFSEDETSSDMIRIPVILKADADGTLAALRDSVLNIANESQLNLCIDPISLNVGHVNVSDVQLASESGASILCFNLKGTKDKDAMHLAASNDVDIRGHNIIYHLLDEAKDVFSTYCPPTAVEVFHGKATVKAVFDITGKNAGRIAGLQVNEGNLYLKKSEKEKGFLDCEYRVVRGGAVISPDGLQAESLRRLKEEVTDVRRGDECGLGLREFSDVEEGDSIECFSITHEKIFV